MALSVRAKTLLNSLAKRGDYASQAILEAGGPGHEEVVVLSNVSAKAANNVVTSKRGDAASNVLAIEAAAAAILAAAPRNVRAVFGATWDGGDVTVTGTNQFGHPQTEVLADVAGQTVVGEKVFKTVTAVSKGAVGVDATGTNTVTLGTGDKLAVGKKKLTSTFVEVRIAGANDDATIDVANSAFTPTTVPDGQVDYEILAR